MLSGTSYLIVFVHLTGLLKVKEIFFIYFLIFFRMSNFMFNIFESWSKFRYTITWSAWDKYKLSVLSPIYYQLPFICYKKTLFILHHVREGIYNTSEWFCEHNYCNHKWNLLYVTISNFGLFSFCVGIVDVREPVDSDFNVGRLMGLFNINRLHMRAELCLIFTYIYILF